MGLIVTELKKRQPELPYFQEDFEGEYPVEAPFTIGELEEIYPTASTKAKEDEAYREEALHATYLLQNGHRGYTAIWKHIMSVSVADLKKNYQNLNVEFDLWKGESDAQPYIPDMIRELKEKGDGYEGDSTVYDPEIRRRFSLRNNGSCNTDSERAGLSSEPYNLCGGQASGAAFCSGVPRC